MPSRYQITLGGTTFSANQGDVLLDAALRNGVNLPHDCRAGHCGACCVRLVSGKVDGGEGNTPGIVHACQCRIAGDATFERREAPAIRTVGGILSSLRALSSEVMEVGITTHRAIPYLAGQYVKVQFDGYPDRPFSISHALSGRQTARTIWFHIRRMENGRVSPALGNRIRLGHHVTLTGP
jgi:3-phenylpropionate/trans-cinnamate dioxygenase ferredoxin reductase subunit